MRPFAARLVVAIVLFALAACTAQPAADSPAVKTLEAYLQALVDKDENSLVGLACPEKEMDVLLELDAFQGVDTSLDGLACAQTGQQDDATLVTCQGKIVATYANEKQEFDLSKRAYRLVPQGDGMLVCGYSASR
jgi:hypothetical protein